MLVSSLFLAAFLQQSPEFQPAPREFRAAWIATVANIDWPSRPGLPTAEARRELDDLIALSAELNLNALVFQIRPHGDALYNSSFEPWSYYLTGEQGRSPDEDWDPLEYLIEEAGKVGIEVHAWFNPYRAQHPSHRGPVHSTHVINTRPDAVVDYGTFKWMDPGNEFVRELTMRVMMDVAERYDVAGVHIDDYFYPYPITENGQKVDFPDSGSYQRYRATGGTLSRDDWRRDNVNRFIRDFYADLKREHRHVQFGISPFGIYRPGIPEGIRAGVDQYAELYADARLWLVEGWTDYYTPQLYWPIRQEPQSYPVLLDWWLQQNPLNRHIWPGNFTSRTNPNDGNWPAREILEQIEITRNRQGSTGNVHFSIRALQLNWNNIQTELKTAYADRVLIPPTPWLADTTPDAPEVRVSSANQTVEVSVGEFIRFVAVYDLADNSRLVKVTTPDNLEFNDLPTRFAITAIDRVNQESQPTFGTRS